MTRRVNDQIKERMPECLIGWLPVRQCIQFHSHSLTQPFCHLPVKCAHWKLVQEPFTKIKANTPHKTNWETLFLFPGGENAWKFSQFVALSFGFWVECLTISFHLFSIALFTFSAFQFVLYLLLAQKGWPRIAELFDSYRGKGDERLTVSSLPLVQEINEI